MFNPLLTEHELDTLEEIRQEILKSLCQKYGEDKVRQVDNLGSEITSRMLDGEKIEGLEQWMYDVVNDFQSMLLSHPSIFFPALN